MPCSQWLPRSSSTGIWLCSTGISFTTTGTMSITTPVTVSMKMIITSVTASQRGVLPRNQACTRLTSGLSA